VFSLRGEDSVDGGGWAEQSFLSGVPTSAARNGGTAKKDETREAGGDVEGVDLHFWFNEFWIIWY